MSNLPNFPTIRPSLLLDFANSKQVDPRITFTRASTATYFDAQGVLRTAASGVPRIDHDPATGECKGLLIEEARTNLIPNNTMQGAVIGSPGTIPTGWSVTGTENGLTRSVVATGEENGINYVDVRFNGTPTINNASFVFAGVNSIAAASGQAWTLSAYLRLVGGSFANTSPVLDILETDGTVGIAGNWAPCVATGQPLATQRFVNVTTVDAVGTTHVQPRIRVGLTIGQPVDFTLRIGMPQFEAGVFATSVIPTTSAAATRAADVPVMTGANFSEWYRQDEGTFVMSFSRAVAAPSTRAPCLLAVINGNNSANSMAFTGGYTNPQQQCFDVTVAGVITSQNLLTSGITSGQTYVVAAAYKADDIGGSFGGGRAVTDTSSAVPTVDNLVIGGFTGPTHNLNGHIKRIAYYLKRLSNSELQTITT